MISKFEDYIETNRECLDVVNYVISVGPELVADIGGIRNLLFSDRNPLEIADFIIASIKTNKYIEKNRKHDKNYLPNLYKTYLKFAKPNFALPERTFYLYYKSIVNISLDKEELAINKNILEAICVLRNSEVKENIIKEIYIKLVNGMSVSIYDLWPDIDRLSIDSNHMYAETYINFMKKIKTSSIYDLLDFLSYYYLDENGNDVVLENRFVYPRTVSTTLNFEDSGPLLIINPSYYFINRWFINRYPLNNRKTLFFIKDNDIISILNSKLQYNSKFYFYNIDDLEDFISNQENAPSTSLLFANHLNIGINIAKSIEILKNHPTNKHQLLLFVPDPLIKNPASNLNKALNNMNIYQIDLLPSGIENSTEPQRKMLIYANYGYTDKHKSVLVKQYKLLKNNIEILSGKAFSLEIDLNDFLKSPASLRSTFYTKNRENENKTNKERHEAVTYEYSKEIVTEYTSSGKGSKDSPTRLTVFVLNPKDKKRIVECKASTKFCGDKYSAVTWINNVLEGKPQKYNHIRKTISSLYIPFFEGKEISFKSFIYIHEELNNVLPEYSKNLFSVINESYLSYIPLNKFTEDIINSFYEENNCFQICTKSQYLNILSTIFDYAITNKNTSNNPAKNVLKYQKEEDWGLSSVKNALTQKFFYPNQIKKIEKYATKLIMCGNDIGLGIAILIRLYLGLEANIVTALKWKDFIYDNKEFPYLIIQRQVTNEGDCFSPFVSNGQIRKMPLVSPIYKVLLTERNRQLSLITKGDEKYLKDCTIVYGKDNIINGQSYVYSPIQLNTKIRKLIKLIGLDEDSIVIPSIKGGTVEVNLSYYQGDIFKYNYWHYIVKEHPNVRPGELYHLCGNKIPEDTLSNHYVDYGSDLSIKRLYNIQPTFKEKKQ